MWPCRGNIISVVRREKAIPQLLFWNSSWCGHSYSLGKLLKLNQKTGLCLINRLPGESYRKSYGTFNSHSLCELRFRETSSRSQTLRNQKINKNNETDPFAYIYIYIFKLMVWRTWDVWFLCLGLVNDKFGGIHFRVWDLTYHWLSLDVMLLSLCLTSAHNNRMNFTHRGYCHLNVKQWLLFERKGSFMIFPCLKRWLKQWNSLFCFGV